MRWRFVDHIDAFEPWRSVSGRKAISFEEYGLLKPFGREGDFPESLVLESCVHLVRWLAAKSSCFEQTCELAAVDGFTFRERARMDNVLTLSVKVTHRDGDGLVAECRATTCGGIPVAEGTIAVRLIPLAGAFDRDTTETMWQELHGSP